MLHQVADGVWVRQSEWVWSNAVVVRGEGGLTLVDPGIDGADLDQLADDVDRLGIPLPADEVPVPGEIIEHQAHAPGHAAILVPGHGAVAEGPGSRPASPSTVPTSTRCGRERNRSMRGWFRTGSPAPTRRMWSVPDTHPADVAVIGPSQASRLWWHHDERSYHRSWSASAAGHETGARPRMRIPWCGSTASC
jgi:hypothetical protein